MKCNKCNKKATNNVDNKRWCDLHLNKFLRSPKARKAVIATWKGML